MRETGAMDKKKGMFEKEAWLNSILSLWPVALLAVLIIFFMVKRFVQ